MRVSARAGYFEAERLTRKRRAFHQRTQFRPGDLRMGTATEAAIDACDDVLLAQQLGVTLQTLRDQFRMFDHVGRMGDEAGNENLSFRQLHLFPYRNLVLVAHIGGFDQIRLRPDLEHKGDDVTEFKIEGVWAVPAPPAQVIAHAVFRNVAERVVERLDAHGATGAEGLKPHANADTVPQCGKPGVVNLKNKTGGDDRFVFDAHGFGDGEHILLVALVETIAPVDFETRRSSG